MRLVRGGLVVSVALLGALLVLASPAPAVTLVECNGPVSSYSPGSRGVKENQPLPTVLAVNCLPEDQTVSVSDIDFGDGGTGPPLVSYTDGSQGVRSALIGANHSYPRATCPRGFCSNRFSVTATATVDQTGQVIPLRADVTVAPGPDVVALAPVRLRTHELFRGRLASIQTGGVRFLGEVSARIDWGDGRKSRATVGGFGRAYEVYGHHHWARPGVYNVKLVIRDGFTGERTTRYLRAHVEPAEAPQR